MRRKISHCLVIAAFIAICAGCSRPDADDYKPSKRARELNNRAVRALADKDFEHALQLVNETVTLEPEFYKAYANKAAILDAMGREEEAAATLDAVIKMRADFADAYVPLGVLREKAGKAEEAERLYRKGLELYTAEIARKPDSMDAVRDRAITLYLLNDREQAVTILRGILAKNPRDTKTQNALKRIENGSREQFLGVAEQ
jgi:tetratricopeptide (TPR) repeat protein